MLRKTVLAFSKTAALYANHRASASSSPPLAASCTALNKKKAHDVVAKVFNEENNNNNTGLGLLAGIPDVRSADFYTRKMNLPEASKMVMDYNYIYASALRDAGGDVIKLDTNLKKIEKSAVAFMKLGQMWDRAELKSHLESIASSKGKFVCLLAGKSTGKSLILRNLEQDHMEKVFVVNLRLHGPDILEGLRNVLQERKSYFSKSVEKMKSVVFPAVGAAMPSVGAAMPLGIGGVVSKVIEELLKDDDPATKTLSVLVNGLIKGLGNNVTLIIDEANIAFNIKETTKEEKVESTKAALELFTFLTKEAQKVIRLFSTFLFLLIIIIFLFQFLVERDPRFK